MAESTSAESSYQKSSRLVGLTGGIAAGKSAVSTFFSQLGAHCIDADELARSVTRPGQAALSEIQKEFGPQVILANGELNRARLAEIVFSDKQARQTLQNITHPRIAELSQKMIRQALDSDSPLVIYVAPLLFEVGLDAWLKPVIVVDIDADTQRSRLLARDDQAALARIPNQMPLAQKRARADYIIDNRGDIENTRMQVQKLWKTLI